jgi:hypothetical protein
MLKQDTGRVHDLARRAQRVRRRLIEHSMPLAERVAARYRGESTTLAHVDLEREAMVGLIRAVDTFDRDKGASFKTWVEVKARGAILDALRKQGHPVHLSEKANSEYLAYRRAVEALAQRYDAQPTDEEIARELGTTVSRVRRVASYVPEVLPLDVEDEDTGLTLEEITPAPPRERPLDFSQAADVIMGSLSWRASYILDHSVPIEGPKLPRARIAQNVGLTEGEVKARLARIKRYLKRDPRVLALKEAQGYVTALEREAESRRRLARLPKHPPGAPLREPVRPKRAPRPPGVRRYTLGEAERLALVRRCEEKYGKPKKSALSGASGKKSARYSN